MIRIRDTVTAVDDEKATESDKEPERGTFIPQRKSIKSNHFLAPPLGGGGVEFVEGGPGGGCIIGGAPGGAPICCWRAARVEGSTASIGQGGITAPNCGI